MEDKEFIKDKILPKILKGEFIRGNNSIIIEFPFVLNDGGRNVEIPKEELNDLLKDRYIKENPNIDKYCIDNVTMFRGLFMNEYEVHSDCKE